MSTGCRPRPTKNLKSRKEAPLGVPGSTARRLLCAGVFLGTHFEGFSVLMPMMTLGLLANLMFGYCPLSRLLYLLPLNRTLPISWGLLVRVVVQPPQTGRFYAQMPERPPGEGVLPCDNESEVS